ncbi:mechanosensitive ion channel domain-containing protein [Flavivirga abyssicola]|uniref:mechanosensitive ion channel family protein n=1 Tax=Flavivirga abyssicola TaxID=3063533 RepID=UPI0026DEB7BA|nr:mechanosensitive ion channel domain-containing protein [Flavivirga sp. MEBiC07777]WVK13297.1 mechanosensitive ion channel domain-containing protein [Flavivirga sp. MEBiC07777]
MEEATKAKDVAMESLRKMWLEITDIFPNIIGTIIVLFIGWLVTKLVIKIIKKALKLAKTNKLDAAINDIEIVEGKKLNFDTVKVISNFVKWVMYIMLLIMASDIMNLTMISEQISNLLGYLPQLFSALVIFTVGLILANVIKKGLKTFFESMDLSGAKVISQVVFFIILIFTSITALNQAGVNTEIITSNLTMILAAFLLAFALAFGFGAQKVVGDVLKAFYTRKIYEIGQVIEFNDIKGEVETIDSISITLKTKEGKLVIPIKDIVESQVKIKD